MQALAKGGQADVKYLERTLHSGQPYFTYPNLKWVTCGGQGLHPVGDLLLFQEIWQMKEPVLTFKCCFV